MDSKHNVSNFSYSFKNVFLRMAFFTWEDKGLTSDCSSLEAMAYRFEETANLMKRLSKKGFELKNSNQGQLIIHSDPAVFDECGFISEELPFKQLSLRLDEDKC